MAEELINDDDDKKSKSNEKRNLRITNAIKESYSYQAFNPHLWFQSPSKPNENQTKAEALIELQDKRLAEIHYKFAIKEYNECFEICLKQLEIEEKNNKKAALFETIFTCCAFLPRIEDQKVLELIGLSKEHWKNVPSVGLKAAPLLLKLGDEEGAILAIVPALLHCGHPRIRHIINNALFYTSDADRLIRVLVDRLIEEKSTPKLIANRLEILKSSQSESEVTWDDLIHGLVSFVCDIKAFCS